MGIGRIIKRINFNNKRDSSITFRQERTCEILPRLMIDIPKIMVNGEWCHKLNYITLSWLFWDLEYYISIYELDNESEDIGNCCEQYTK